LINIPKWIVLPILAIGISKNDKKLAQKILPRKVGKFMGKQLFLAIFAKFGTIWQPYMRPQDIPPRRPHNVVQASVATRQWINARKMAERSEQKILQ